MKYFLPILLLLFVISCNKKPEIVPAPMACFAWSPDTLVHVGTTVHFANCSENSGGYLWSFGDAETSTDMLPVHVYRTTGGFRVTLIAYGVDQTDTLSKTIEVSEKPAPKYIRIIHNKELVSTDGRGGVYTLDLDVDGDGVPDYQFKLDSWSQLSGDGWSKGSIRGIHGTFGVSIFSTPDTTFLSKTWRVMDGSYWNKKIAIIRTETETCARILEQDSILRIESTNQLSHFDQEPLTNAGPIWTTSEMFFWNLRVNGPGLYKEKENADSIWFITYGNKIQNCHDFPADTAYIGIRYVYGEIDKTGWIRLLVKNRKIRILESGIME